MSSKHNDFRELSKAYSLVISLGLNIAVCIGICTYFGMYLDSKFNIKPAFTLAGVGIGLLAGLWSAFKMLKKFIERK